MISGKVTKAATSDVDGVKSLSILTDIPSRKSELGYHYFDFQLTPDGELFVVSDDQNWWAAEVRNANVQEQIFRLELRTATATEFFEFETGAWGHLIKATIARWPSELRFPQN